MPTGLAFRRWKILSALTVAFAACCVLVTGRYGGVAGALSSIGRAFAYPAEFLCGPLLPQSTTDCCDVPPHPAFSACVWVSVVVMALLVSAVVATMTAFLGIPPVSTWRPRSLAITSVAWATVASGLAVQAPPPHQFFTEPRPLDSSTVIAVIYWCVYTALGIWVPIGVLLAIRRRGKGGLRVDAAA